MATLTYIINETSHKGRYKKLENLGNSGWLPPNTSCPVDVWFPWVHNVTDFINKVLIIELMGKIRFYVWEADGNLYVSQTEAKGAVTPYTAVDADEINMETDPFIDADPQLFYKPHIAKGDYKAQEKWIYIRPYGQTFELIFKNPE
jgi:hypothetical protein